MLGGFISSAMTLIDSFFIARYSLHAFNAIILVLPLIEIIISLSSAIGASLVNLLGKEQNTDYYKYHISFGFLINLILCAVITVLCYAGKDTALAAVGLSGNRMPIEQEYFSAFWKYITPSFFLQMFFSMCLQLLVFSRQTRFANLLMLLVTLVNLFFDFLFVVVFDFGVKGAAIATLLAFLTGLLVAIFRYRTIIKGAVREIQLRVCRYLWKDSVGAQLYTSFILFISLSTYVIGNILINNLAVLYGSTAVTVLGVSEQLKALFTLSTRGITGAFIIEFNASLKKKETTGYWPLYRNATLLVGLLYGVGIILFTLFPQLLLSIFSISDPAVTELMHYSFQIAAILFIVLTISRIGQVGFLCLGYSYVLFLQSLSGVTLMYLCARHFSGLRGIPGIIDGQLLGFFLTALLFVPLYFLMLQKRVRLDRE